ncbi:LysR family transcriptional regulator [Streptomyces antimycoticus]|uniref:LysR family transcriptional regulator n=1 Tax=Streptomyces antimycoticus TaxID=68175 RepID=UPI00367C7592
MGNRPDFSLTQLLYFVTIAETGNISEAATRLHASQSAVSSAIQRLERQLGSQLLLRQHAKGVTLSPSGRLLLNEARAILRQARSLKDYSSRLQQDAVGQLDVGCCQTITPFLIPRTLVRLAKSHPGITVNVHDTMRPCESLLNGVCELLVTYDLTRLEGERFIELATPSLYALISRDHPLANAERVSLAELVDQPLLMLDLPIGSSYSEYTRTIFHQANVPMPKVIHVTGLEAMRGLAGANVGFMLTHHRPFSMETLDGSQVALLEVTDDRPHLSLGVKMLAGTASNQRMACFVAALRETAREIYSRTPIEPFS